MSLAKTDGRLGRSQRSRAALIDAFLALIDQGDLRPTAPRIAARAGVSLRLVFHHFKDLEAVLAEAAKREIERVMPTIRPASSDGPLEERIDEFVEERSRLLEQVFTMWRAASLQEPFSVEIARHMKLVRAWMQKDADRVFARELQALRGAERTEVAHALHALTSMATWEDLRLHQDLTVDKSRKVTARALTALLRRR